MHECFKKLRMLKPGISGTCCDPRKIPINARVVVFSFVMSVLLKIMLPDFTVYDGFPAIVFDKVDFPDPLCPDNKMRAPVSICNDISCSNSRSDKVTVRASVRLEREAELIDSFFSASSGRVLGKRVGETLRPGELLEIP